MRAHILTPAVIAAVLIPLMSWPAHATQPALSINDVTVTEPYFETKVATFSVSLNKASDEPVTVHYATSDPGDQIQATSGDLAIAAGATSATIPVTVKYSPSKADFHFTVTLTDPRGAAIADGSGAGTVVNITPTGVFLCQAWERTGALGTGLTAGTPDRCVTDQKSTSVDGVNAVKVRTDSAYAPHSRVDLGEYSTVLPTVCLDIGGCSPGSPTAFTIRLRVAAVESLASATCTNNSGTSSVRNVYLSTGDGHIPFSSSGGTAYQSHELPGGYRIEFNVTERSAADDTTLLRQTAVRVTEPDGSVTNIGVAEAGQRGKACFS